MTKTSPSLRQRIVLASFAMALFICILFAAGLFIAFEFADDSLFDQHLEADMSALMRQHALSPRVAPLQRDDIQVFISPGNDTSNLPEYLRSLPPGTDEIRHNGRPLDLEVRRDQGYTYYFLIEETPMENFERLLIVSVVIIVVLVCLASSLLGWLFANDIIRPVRLLAGRVNSMERQQPETGIGSAESKDEIEILGQAIDSFQARVSELLQREREFSSDVSHELRTPLMGVQSAAENLQIQAGNEMKVTELAERIQSRCRHMRMLIDSMLYLARHPTSLENDFSEVDLREIILSELDNAAPYIDGRKIDIQLIEEARPLVFSTETILSVVFGNLLRNAVLHSDSSTIRIELNDAGLVIRDFGHGIPKELRRHVFDRYVNGGDTSSGFGIGLSLVKRLCDHFGWTLTMQSDPEQGTSIAVGFGDSLRQA